MYQEVLLIIIGNILDIFLNWRIFLRWANYYFECQLSISKCYNNPTNSVFICVTMETLINFVLSDNSGLKLFAFNNVIIVNC